MKDFILITLLILILPLLLFSLIMAYVKIIELLVDLWEDVVYWWKYQR